MAAEELAGLPAAAQTMKEAALLGMADWAEYVLQQATQQVPIEEGVLSASGVAVLDRDEGIAYVGFGRGAASGYAVRQHEVPMRHDAGRKDHYLSDPVAESESKAEQIIAARIRQALA